jgi:hypothetical protein
VKAKRTQQVKHQQQATQPWMNKKSLDYEFENDWLSWSTCFMPTMNVFHLPSCACPVFLCVNFKSTKNGAVLKYH